MSASIAVLDYGIGNLRSAEKALEHVGADAFLSADPDRIAEAAGVVLPGVGSFGRCMAALRASGLDQVALDAIGRGTPFLGICVGMQMLYRGSEESPGVAGLGVFDGVVREITGDVKRPQMQWNQLDAVPVDAVPVDVVPVDVVLGAANPAAMLAGLVAPIWVYFVHSFAAEPTEGVVATCDYGGPLVAAVERGNVWATQFHPEKSGPTGLHILTNFVDAAVAASDPARTTS